MVLLLCGNVGPGSAPWSSENDYRQTLEGMGHELTLMAEADHSTCGSYQFVRERGPMASNAFPEQYPMLRTLQFALCGYYKVVSP